MRPGFSAMLLVVAAAGVAQADGTVAWTLEGFDQPESVAADPSSGMLFVSNMGGDPMSRDGNGHISRITADGTLDKVDWATGLDSPKGMDVAGGILYVADIDQLVEIDAATGEVKDRHKVDGAQLLNDVAAAPDGRVFVSDTAGAAIYVLENGTVSLFVQDPDLLMGANGLYVAGETLLVADLGDMSGGFDNIKPGPVVQVDLATKAIAHYGAEGPVGVLDGIEPDGNGGVLLTENPQGKLLALTPGGTTTEVATVGSGAADLEFLPEQRLAVIPITPTNQVVAIRLD